MLYVPPNGLTTYSASLNADVSLPQNTPELIFTTPVLPVGSYLLIASLDITLTTGESVDVVCALGTALGTITGKSSDTVGYAAGAGVTLYPVSTIAAILNITTAGTITITAEMYGSSTAATVRRYSFNQSNPNASGYSIIGPNI